MADTKPDDLNQIAFAVYATQGGGLARYQGDVLVWHEPPKEFPEFRVGDPVPEEWGTIPVNAAAREEMFDEEFLNGV